MAITLNDLLARRNVSSFSTLLNAYCLSGYVFRNALDGGAGAGHTAKEMLKYIAGDVYAFEPFHGNHRFFDTAHPRVRLIPKALAECEKTMAFRVSSVVSEDSAWGRKGMTGYSSVGRLVEKPADTDLEIACVAAQDLVTDVDFIKLDLQGGELPALRGLERLLPAVPLMWVEYSGQSGLADYLVEAGFELYDTEYMFVGDMLPEAAELFEKSRADVALSTGRSAWFGFRSRPWIDFFGEFMDCRKRLGLVQTDLVCVNRRMQLSFDLAMHNLPTASLGDR